MPIPLAGVFTSLIAAVVAAAAALLINRLALRFWGTGVIVWLVPAVEEVTKTTVALIWHAPLLITHILFGAVEAVYDMATSPETGMVAGLLSVFGHALFGYTVVLGLRWFDSIFIGAAAGILLHILWNGVVMKFVVR
ncbi:MAG: hypothetical protein ACM3TT_03115 [Syntrophothermus sp.]